MPAKKKPAAKPAKSAAKAKPAKAAEKKEKAPAKASGTYHVKKRADGKWEIRISGSSKVIKTFNTQAEAVAFANDRTARTGRGAVVHKSKGPNKGQVRSAKK
jgi:hypothetical protein